MHLSSAHKISNKFDMLHASFKQLDAWHEWPHTLQKLTLGMMHDSVWGPIRFMQASSKVQAAWCLAWMAPHTSKNWCMAWCLAWCMIVCGGLKGSASPAWSSLATRTSPHTRINTEPLLARTYQRIFIIAAQQFTTEIQKIWTIIFKYTDQKLDRIIYIDLQQIIIDAHFNWIVI